MSGFVITRRMLMQVAATLPAAGLLTGFDDTAWAQSSGKTLTLAIPNSPNTLDPINAVLQDPMVINQCIFENLVEYDVDGVLRPQLARALPEISADKLTYTFDLRDDVQFQNGQPMTSEDVKYSFESMLDKKRNAARRVIFEKIARVETDGPHRVHVILSEPYAPWLNFLTKYMGIWPAGSRERYGDDYFKMKPVGIGTGPGIFEEWRPNQSVTLKRNPNYWDKSLPKWERLVVKFVPEDATRTAYLLARQADIIGAPAPRDFASLSKRSGLAGEVRSTFGGWSTLMMNNAKPPFDDINVRRAVNWAIDRQKLAQYAFFGMVDPCTLPAPRQAWWYDAEADGSIGYDPEKAKGFLAQSKHATDAAFEMTLPATPYLLDLKDAAVAIQSQLQAVGIRCTLKMTEPLVALGQAKKGELQALLMNLTSPGEPTYLLGQNFTENQPYSKVSGYAAPEIADLLKQAYAENDQAALKPIYAKILKKIADDCPYAWLGFLNAANLWRGNVTDFRVNQGITMDVRSVGLKA
ncbi:peptide/nickel transport system substrate-binding protein [Faunimonas pinastri]|uniref:Peptide/nickel transport system substrate-binding protein n=1 Tax=Faunimonas pinastri TaxID=1855383 RepID=A0A1H9B6N3_9HYPH|nr:ABC transporter substrate-binding protein [Faunimonas pinastri]SEP84333.1 peptide/nickel transport system substrate-binding protein [Faunimonas pinastri]